METTIHKWGNSLAIRIPGGYAKGLRLQEGSSVHLIEEDNKLVIIPGKSSLKLKDLLLEMNDDNIHKEEFAEEPVGKEIW